MAQTKSDWRCALLAARAAIPETTRRVASDAIARRVLALPEFVAAGSILGYVALGAEVDAATLLAEASAAKIRAYVPCADHSIEHPLWTEYGRCATAHEGVEAQALSYPVFAIVPGVGFDFSGTRLGRGSGFYDRALAALREGGSRSGRWARLRVSDRSGAPARSVGSGRRRRRVRAACRDSEPGWQSKKGGARAMIELALALLVAAVVIGGIVALSIRRRTDSQDRLHRAEEESRRATEDTRRASETMLEQARLKAESIVLQARADHEERAQRERLEFQAIERRLLAREEAIDLRTATLEGRSADLAKQEQSLLDRKEHVSASEAEVARLAAAAREALEHAAGLTREEAKRAVLEEIVAEARHEAGKRIRQVEEEAREEADRKAKKIITIAIERLAGDFIAERTVSVVHLPSDDMKGRIIGREGRNIRAIEAATGVDLIIDDTPEAVIVSCHSPDPSRDRAHCARATDFGWAHPSGSDRGGRPQGRAGGRGERPRGRPAGDFRGRRARRSSRDRQAARDAEVPLLATRRTC